MLIVIGNTRYTEQLQIYLLHSKAAVHVTTNVLYQWLQIKQIQSITGQKYTLFTNIYRKDAKRLRCFSFLGNVFQQKVRIDCNTPNIRVIFEKMFSSRVRNQMRLLNGNFPISTALTSQGSSLVQFNSKWFIAHTFLPLGMHTKYSRYRKLCRKIWKFWKIK